MTLPASINWKPEPDEHDYPAAQDYLDLVFGRLDSSNLVARLRLVGGVQKHAKDIIRASGLPLLSQDDPHVRRNLKKIRAGEPISPILLVRGYHGGNLIVADGFHRICAVYHYNYDAEVPCKLV